MAQSLETSQLKIQQTLTVYLFAFAAMSLWHGAAVRRAGTQAGDRRLARGLCVASIGCAIAGNVEIADPVSPAAGTFGGRRMAGRARAIIRDRLHGPDARHG